jgi:glycosyltransferase involved in cell wall biosynthesis
VRSDPAVLFSDHNPSRFNGGEELVLREILLGLAARGWRCLLAYHRWGDLVPEYEAAGIVCRRFDLNPARLSEPWRFAASVAQQALWARREGVRLLHCNSYFRAAHTGAVKRLGGFPALCHFHLGPPEYLSRQYRWGLRRMDGFIAVSKWSGVEWSGALEMASEYFDVLHNPIDTARFRPDNGKRDSARSELEVADDCTVVGYCGRLVQDKGVGVLVQAMARLVHARGPIMLMIIGGDHQNVVLHGERLEPKLRELCAQLGVTEQVLFMGARADVDRWYNAMDILAVPTPFAEAFGLVVAEGLACGLPVVASRVGGIPEILSGPLEELLTPPNDVGALAAGLDRLIGDPERRMRLGRAGREIVERNFGVPAYLAKLEQLFERALMSPRSVA